MNDDALAALTISQLKAVLADNHVNARNLIEKVDLVDKVRTLAHNERADRLRRAEEEEREAREERERQEGDEEEGEAGLHGGDGGWRGIDKLRQQQRAAMAGERDATETVSEEAACTERGGLERTTRRGLYMIRGQGRPLCLSLSPIASRSARVRGKRGKLR